VYNEYKKGRCLIMEITFTDKEVLELVDAMGAEIAVNYIKWCEDNLIRHLDEWFGGKDYTNQDLRRYSSILMPYIADKFYRWAISGGLMEED
jgi:hypothetical protein